jgi:biopolymer transport protein ExbB
MVRHVMNSHTSVEYPVLMDAKMSCRKVSSVVATCRAIYWAAVIALCVPSLAFAQEGQPADGPVGNALLPRDLTLRGMFENADVVVQAVLIGLAVASVVTWTVWLAKTIELIVVKRRVRADLSWLSKVRTSEGSLERLVQARSIVGKFIGAAVTELQLSGTGMEKDGIKERIASRLERLEAAGARRIMRGTGVLATIGATAPFVGLFGTVWGIMNSFIGISKSHTTNLAVVAPGIAEALLATAFGLAAAIPAVVIYNMFSRQIAGYRALMGDGSAEVLRLVSRDLDYQEAGPSVSRRKPSLSAAE